MSFEQAVKLMLEGNFLAIQSYSHNEVITLKDNDFIMHQIPALQKGYNKGEKLDFGKLKLEIFSSNDWVVVDPESGEEKCLNY